MGKLSTLNKLGGLGDEESQGFKEIELIQGVRAQRDLLKHVLLQLKIANKHLSIISGEIITADDIEDDE